MSPQTRIRLKRRAVALILLSWWAMPRRAKLWAFLNDPDDGGPELPFEDIQ